ncbi:hypothetical protein ACIBQ1_05650 [Nonomuraea sp. NPDC050153]|uniref:hypothetical protein n=1 Tax=Nonomuraea sp. NPDC050153 TaxID=3364359 RepID=UPI0037A7982B
MDQLASSNRRFDPQAQTNQGHEAEDAKDLPRWLAILKKQRTTAESGTKDENHAAKCAYGLNLVAIVGRRLTKYWLFRFGHGGEPYTLAQQCGSPARHLYFAPPDLPVCLAHPLGSAWTWHRAGQLHLDRFQ